MDQKTEEYARKVIDLAIDTITVRYRFFDRTLYKIKFEPAERLNGYVSDVTTLFYDPVILLKDYLKEPSFAVRLCLHVMFHLVFLHPFTRDERDRELWDMACDIAVTNAILSLEDSGLYMSGDDERKTVISKIRKWVPNLTAQKLYREFAAQGVSNDAKTNYKRLFTMDAHSYDKEKSDEILFTEEEFKKLSERIKAELKSFSKEGEGSEEILKNLKEATKVKHDYEHLLRRFASESELIKINPDEFDYVYYMYGLSLYDNMPLIEPLEYADDKRIKDFVIAIDTSASCRGDMVKKFIETSYNILRSENTFFDEVNIHIVQCDSAIRNVTKIKNKSDLDEYVENFTLSGFGATDFRPVFEYVNEKTEDKTFENLKGIIYFTDGYGVYPTEKPKYDVVFAYAEEDELRPKAPSWATGCVVEDRTI